MTATTAVFLNEYELSWDLASAIWFSSFSLNILFVVNINALSFCVIPDWITSYSTVLLIAFASVTLLVEAIFERSVFRTVLWVGDIDFSLKASSKRLLTPTSSLL